VENFTKKQPINNPNKMVTKEGIAKHELGEKFIFLNHEIVDLEAENCKNYKDCVAMAKSFFESELAESNTNDYASWLVGLCVKYRNGCFVYDETNWINDKRPCQYLTCFQQILWNIQMSRNRKELYDSGASYLCVPYEDVVKPNLQFIISQ
jgi:hypothetical protein